MPSKSKVYIEFQDCPICEGKGTVPSRLPFRTKPCDQCRGRGVVTPIRRQHLLAEKDKRR
jgi:DnaJ-class molecular chaperone